MGTYVVTGSASGMGAAVVERLRAAGHDVITVDIRDADIAADLSDPVALRHAATEVLERAGGALHGAVLAAGVGPEAGREGLIAAVNYTAPTVLLGRWRDALASAAASSGTSSKVVVFGSNSASVTPGIPTALVRTFLNNRPVARRRLLRLFGKNAPAFAYGASKLALSRWVRRTAPTVEWAGSGIRLNVIAPGAIATPLLQAQLDGPDRERIETFPIPTGSYGDPGHIADWAVFMLSPSADFLCGSVIYVDGGSDAYFRADSWPASAPLRTVPRFLKQVASFNDPRV